MKRLVRAVYGSVLFSLSLLPSTAFAQDELAPSVELVERLTAAAPESAVAPEVLGVEKTTIFGLPQNVGTADRIIRGVLAVSLAGVGGYRLANDAPNPTLSAVLLGVSVIPAATGATGYCPLYQAAGIDTN